MDRRLFLAACVLGGGSLGAALHFGALVRTPAGDAASVHAVTDVAPAPPPRGTSTTAAAAGASTDLDTSSVSVADDTVPGRRAPYSYHDGIMRVAPSVVSLYASIEESLGNGEMAGEEDPVGRPRRLSQGSGVIVDPDGIVLTNLHLIEHAVAINVVLGDGTPHVGTLLGSDRETDLAIVRIDASGLSAVPLDDAPPLRVGDVVLAIGNPFGVGQTVTQGIVSATRRRIAGGSAWQDFVQIDAAINPGSSGGALINPDGQLVGVTTAVFRGDTRPEGAGSAGGAAGGDAQGIGFAIPAGLLARVVPEIIADGRVVRGWLGVGVDDLPMFPDLHRSIARGAVITALAADGPAAAGGLRPRDVVTHVDGRVIEDATGLLLLISSLEPGRSVRVELERDGVPLALDVTLDERPSAPAAVAPR